MRIPHIGKWIILAALLGAQGAVSASSAIRPEPIDAGDLCSRCKRIIFERHIAAEALSGSESAPLKFRTVRCMLAYLQNASGPIEGLYVTDYPTGKLVPVERATFVAVPIDARIGMPNYGVGEIDYLAFRSAQEAERMAAQYGVHTQDWASVTDSAAFLPTRGSNE